MVLYVIDIPDLTTVNYFQYIPNFGSAIFFASVFGLITIATTVLSLRYKTRYMWVMAMGTACEFPHVSHCTLN